MPRYLVERTFPERMSLSIDEEGARACAAIVQNDTLDGVTWIHSYVTADKRKSFSICDAPTPEAVRRAAGRNNLPVDRILEVRVLDPYFYV